VSLAGLRPDLVVLLDLPVRDGLARRARGAPEGLTRFERSSAHDMAFHERVRQGYLELAAADPERWRIVDAAREEDVVASDIERVVHEALSASEPRGELLRMHP
jgi:dTMP kinase